MAETPLILVVDDVEDPRVMYGEYLAAHAFRVIEAVDGATAFRQAREKLPALILMDMGLPGIDGWEATRQLKASPTTRHIPVLAIQACVPGFGAARQGGRRRRILHQTVPASNGAREDSGDAGDLKVTRA